MKEESRMVPHVEFDESHTNIAGKQSHVLVLSTPNVVRIKISPDKTKSTIRGEFCQVLNMPLVADMCRGGNAFTGEFQMHCTCLEKK